MVGVLPEYRGRGIGKELCVRTLDRFKEQDVKEVYLETEVHNYTSLALYEVCISHVLHHFYLFFP